MTHQIFPLSRIESDPDLSWEIGIVAPEPLSDCDEDCDYVPDEIES
jgi:hypothetical protein